MLKAARILLLSASALTLGACASAPGAGAGLRPALSASADGHQTGSPYGYYLAGQAALDDGDSRAAVDYFAKASGAAPDAGFIKERVFTSALLSGDLTTAAATAPGPGEGTPSSRVLGVLAQAVEALATGHGAQAYAKLANPEAGAPYSSAVVLLKPWAAAAAGRWADAVTMPETGDRLVKVIASLDQALLFERSGRYPEAETAFKAMMAEQVGQSLILPAYAVFLERRGRRKEAVTVYDQMLASRSGRSLGAGGAEPGPAQGQAAVPAEHHRRGRPGADGARRRGAVGQAARVRPGLSAADPAPGSQPRRRLADGGGHDGRDRRRGRRARGLSAGGRQVGPLCGRPRAPGLELSGRRSRRRPEDRPGASPPPSRTATSPRSPCRTCCAPTTSSRSPPR